MNILKGRKYLALLLTLVLLVVLFPILRAAAGTRVLLDVAFSFVFVSAWLAVFRDSRLRAIAAVLGIPTLVGLWTGYLLPGLPPLPLMIGFHTLAALFFVFMIGVILREIYREEGVTTDSVYGAFCGYLLAGLAFGHIFTIVEILEPGSFRAGGALTVEMPDERRHFLLTYFSFITLATVGYGDIVPRKRYVPRDGHGRSDCWPVLHRCAGRRIDREARQPGRRTPTPSGEINSGLKLPSPFSAVARSDRGGFTPLRNTHIGESQPA